MGTEKGGQKRENEKSNESEKIKGEQRKGERKETGTDMGSGICSIVLQSPQTAFTAH
jgi:hypothetical protein